MAARFGLSFATAAGTALFACGGVADGPALAAQAAGTVFLTALLYRTFGAGGGGRAT